MNVCVCSMCSGSVLLSDLSFLDLYYCYIALYIFFLSLFFLLPVICVVRTTYKKFELVFCVMCCPFTSFDIPFCFLSFRVGV